MLSHKLLHGPPPAIEAADGGASELAFSTTEGRFRRKSANGLLPYISPVVRRSFSRGLRGSLNTKTISAKYRGQLQGRRSECTSLSSQFPYKPGDIQARRFYNGARKPTRPPQNHFRRRRGSNSASIAVSSCSSGTTAALWLCLPSQSQGCCTIGLRS
ncbi:hypothetical protein BD413DRAFT_542175 [Trametes elegans]|nr:hypothetical protein BD413DRAFT_542175 [Trametes elegans]